MKKSIYILRAFSLILGAMLVSSCEDILDVEPVSELSVDNFWTSNRDAEQGLAGVYDAMQKAYRTKKFHWGEFRSDNFVVSDQPNQLTEDMIKNLLSPQATPSLLQWDELYSMILRTNVAIERIPRITSFNPQFLGEAYAIRAYAYFDCYRVWGGVPLFDKSQVVFSEESFKERATPEAVLDLVLSDIKEAEKHLTTLTSRHNFSRTSLMALKAQVLMHTKQYEEANNTLDQLITNGGFELTENRTDWRNLFINDPENFPGEGQEGTELILSIKYSLAEDGNRASGVYETYFTGVPSNWVSPKVVELWENKFPTDSLLWATKYPGVPPHVVDLPDEDESSSEPIIRYGDYRFYETITQVNASNEVDLRISKYAKENISPAIDETDIILFRYADMLLLKAEALNQLNRPDEAIALVNQIRTARELPLVNSGTTPDVINTNDKEELENFILEERQIELLGEGVRWWDLVRTDKAVEVMNPINGMTEQQILWPIWFRHILDNDKLEQNEAYR